MSLRAAVTHSTNFSEEHPLNVSKGYLSLPRGNGKVSRDHLDRYNISLRGLDKSYARVDQYDSFSPVQGL